MAEPVISGKTVGPKQLPTWIVIEIVMVALIIFIGLLDEFYTPLLAPAPTTTPSVIVAQQLIATAAPTQIPAATATALPPLTAVTPVATKISAKDGMVLDFVPAGSFPMGKNPQASTDVPYEIMPQANIELDAFWIDQTEVTNGLYARCVAAKRCSSPKKSVNGSPSSNFKNRQYADYPIVNVNWKQAAAYCKWAGGRLPSEAQWEKAARGVDGRIYPWGNQPPRAALANFNNNPGSAVQVGHYSDGASPFGLLDMAGNVSEWTADWYSDNTNQPGPSANPTGPKSGQFRVIRGGSWADYDWGIRTDNRQGLNPAESFEFVGFRCAISP